MKFNSAKEVRDYLWENLNLDSRSIIFHVIDVGDDIVYYRPELIDTHDDLYDSDAWFDISTVHWDEQEIHVDSVESWMIGDGESWRADYSDCELMEEINEAQPGMMDSFLREYADLLVSLSDFTIDNPSYDPEENAE